MQYSIYNINIDALYKKFTMEFVVLIINSKAWSTISSYRDYSQYLNINTCHCNNMSCN